MLNKLDLVKQFELITKQEIKNYQDSLNHVLQSLNDLQVNLAKAQEELLGKHSQLHSQNNSLSIENQKLKDECQFLRDAFERFQRDQLAINSDNLFMLNAIKQALALKNTVDTINEKYFDEIFSSINKLRADQEADKRIYNDNYDDLFRRMREEIHTVKDEILSAPTDASLVRKDLEEQLSLHKVDVSGIMRELRIYKADNTITQKKIEQIYTLISRLEKSQESTP